MVIGHVGDQRELPAEIDCAIANTQQDVTESQKPQVRREQVHKRHQGDQHTAHRRRGLDEVAAAIKGLAQDQIRQQAADCAGQLQQADIGIAGLETVDEHQRIQRRGHE